MTEFTDGASISSPTFSACRFPNFARNIYALRASLCHNIIAVYMRLPYLFLPTPFGWSFAPRDGTARPISAYLCLTRPLRARSLSWASCPTAGVTDDDGFLLFVAVHVLCAKIFAAWFKRVLHFDSYRYAFNAETLKPLP